MADIINFKEMKAQKEKKHFNNLIKKSIDKEELFAFVGMQTALDVAQFFIEAGYDIQSRPECIRDIFLIIEAVRALGHRVTDTDHSMQLVSDTVFAIFDDEEEMLSEFLEKMYEE